MKDQETPENSPEHAQIDLEQVVSEGVYRASLEALRDRLGAGIDSLSDRQLIHLAPLAKQLADVLCTLEDLPVPDAAADSVESAQSVVELKLRSVQ